jgi:small GTP-binding protein
MDNKKLIHYKFALLGNSNTGKTSICMRYVNKKFEQIFQSTIGCSFLGKVLEINNKSYSLDIWDTAGQERYRALLPMYYRNADIAFICVDIDKSDFTEEINYWIKELNKYCDKISRTIIIVGTKMDLIAKKEQENFKNKINTYYPNYKCFITSSKNNIGINELFNFSINKCIENESINNIVVNNELANLSLDENNSYWGLFDMCNLL